MTTTVRCALRGCKAKTEAALTESQQAGYLDVIGVGAELGDWQPYWDFMREIDARCFQHEGLR